MCAFIVSVCQAEKGGGCQTVGDYKDEGPGEASGCLNEDAPNYEPHVADRGVGN